MTLEAGKEMDRHCVFGWLNEVYRHPTVAFNTYSDEQQIEFAHDALVLLKEQETQKFFVDESGKIIPLPVVVFCKDCKHGSLYCTEDVCGETLIECNRPDLGDVIEIHGWKWFCADGEQK